MAFSSKIRAFFTAVFLIGAVAGAWAMRAYDTQTTSLSTFFSHVSDPAAMTKRILLHDQDRYQLTPEEVARITPLVQEMTQRVYQTRSQFGTDVLSILDSYHQQIGQQLTPPHQEVYQTHWAERRKDFSAMLLIDPAKASPGGS